MAVLIEMTNEKAVVADNVQELNRDDVEKELNELGPMLEQNRKHLEEVEKARETLLTLIPQQEERLNLLSALHNEFEGRFPSKKEPEETTETIDLTNAQVEEVEGNKDENND